MILSRVWYVLLGVAVAVALYVVYVAVGLIRHVLGG